MGLLDRGLPREVEVGGSRISIRCGFRGGVLASGLDRRDPDDRMLALYVFYGAEGWPEEVVRASGAAVDAAFAWLDGAWRSVTYGEGDGSRRRVFDFEADAGIVVCDFQRLYGIDLTDDSTQVHWWRFVQLLAGAMRTEGTMCNQAVYARSPAPQDATKAERERRRRLAAAWKLPPTEDEMREMALREFGR